MFITINNSQDQLYNAMFISHFKKDLENLEIHYFLQNGTKISEKFEDETSLNSKFDLVTNIKFGGASGDGGSGGTDLSNIYSTEETVVGTWIDGKPLYKKTFTSTSNAASFKIPHGASIDTVVAIDGYYRTYGTTWFRLGCMYFVGDIQYLTALRVDKTDIIVGLGNYINREYDIITHITLEYTKTTD